MIPVRLRLENFLSYASPEPIDFTGFDVACLTGPNGMGKSSLLDAMTWALWGQARGCEGGQHQDRVIRDRADDTTVELTFELAGETYRVTRSRSRSGRADLRLAVRSGDDWTVMGGETLRETEAHIADLLRMDYKTFVTSALFVQGRADEFLTDMTPERRKDVFSRLLDLGAYERLEEAARARARTAEARRAEGARVVEELAEVPEAVEALEAGLREADGAKAKAEEQVGEAEEELEATREALGALERLEASRQQEQQAAEEAAERLAEHRESLEAKTEELGAIDEVLIRREEVSAALTELERLRATETRLREDAERRAELERKTAEVAGRLEAARREVEARLRSRRERAETLGAELDRLSEVSVSLEEVDEQLATLEDVDGTLEEVRGQLADLREEDGALGVRIDGLERRRDDVAERIELLEVGEGSCPVCQGPLDEPHRTELLEASRTEALRVAEELDGAVARREEVRKEGHRLAEEQVRLRGVTEEAGRLRARRGEFATRIERVPQLTEELKGVRTAVAADERLLEAGEVAPEIVEELDRLRAAVEGSAYDPEEHERVVGRLKELQGMETLRGRIEQAEERRERVLAERGGLEERIARDAEDLEGRRERCRELAERLEGLAEARGRAERAKTALAELRERAQRAAAEHARVAERREALERDLERLRAAQEAERGAAQDHRLASRLVQAFGRSGIPARIIENALPELTSDANAILGRLTDYEMSVAFRMDKLTKSGTVRETFEVLVHHDGGIRDFQMFSGGEGFRIAFAIRLALSKLLVRRAGARLETLVVDEGFGTQDPEGRERLIEAINLAREEFQKVLVITHLDELKDAFGVQLRVSKDPLEGSSVALLGA